MGNPGLCQYRFGNEFGGQYEKQSFYAYRTVGGHRHYSIAVVYPYACVEPDKRDRTFSHLLFQSGPVEQSVVYVQWRKQ